MTNHSLGERRKEIELMMQYAVPRQHFHEAFALIEKHAGDGVAMNLLHNFYSYLPDARDDGIKTLRQVARRQGVFLLCATTFFADYLYISSMENAVFLGALADGVEEEDVLEFFGFKDRQTFMALIQNPAKLSLYSPANQDEELCPVCSAACGEYHTLGCPVEVCPWCGGQLTHCNCRFIQLGQDWLDGEAEVDRLLEMIEAAGRIPFDVWQRPSYPSSGGIDEFDKDDDYDYDD